MTTRLPPKGSLITYPYLWLSQADQGETEGRKDRPCCLLLQVWDAATETHHLMILAVSSQPPRKDQTALQVPDTERRRGGLARYPAAWVVVSEYNYDIAERSFYLDLAAEVLGAFSPTFMGRIAATLKAEMAQGRTRVNRT